MNEYNSLPVITLGSPHGIGYEIFLRTLGSQMYNNIPPLCIGSSRILKFYLSFLDMSFSFKTISHEDLPLTDENLHEDFVLFDIDQDIIKDYEENFEIDSVQSITPEIDGLCAYYSILMAAKYVDIGYFKSVVTLPVSKKNINLFDSSFIGHTEFFQKIWHEDEVFMTFVGNKFNVLLLTTHIPLDEVCNNLDTILVKKGLRNALSLKKRLNLQKDICFLGVHPHAGENGLLGKEDTWIKNIIDDFNKKNNNVVKGPIPADTAFAPHNIDNHSIYISAYHDQGLIPFKIFSFEDGVNLSYGMRYIRTSVDHGTAIDLIGKKSASTISFENAYKLALKLK